jgi:hypothetical protein
MQASGRQSSRRPIQPSARYLPPTIAIKKSQPSSAAFRSFPPGATTDWLPGITTQLSQAARVVPEAGHGPHPHLSVVLSEPMGGREAR